MAELSVSETTTFRWSFEEDVREYKVEGIPAIGVWRQKLSDYGLTRAVRLLREHGLKVAHLFWAGGFTGSEGRGYREAIEDAQEALRAAAELGCPTLLIYSGTRAGHTFNHARRLVRDALRELLPLAEQFHVTLALEPMHPGCAAGWTFLTSLEETLELLTAINHSRVKMVLDTYHSGQDEGFTERIAEILKHVALVQLGDARHPPQGEQDRCRLGEGRVPLKEIVTALKAGGYDGYYDVELLGREIETADYHSLLRHARDAFRTLVGEG